MHTFFKWVEESGLDLPVFTDVEQGEETTDENRVRTGYSANYPPAYVKDQYPPAYFPPYKGTAYLDKEAKPKKVKDTAAN